MNELQLQKIVKPTSVRVPPATKLWIAQQNTTLAAIVRHGPVWHTRMVELATECRELKENIAAAQARLTKLNEENLDLLRFKERITRKTALRGSITPTGDA